MVNTIELICPHCSHVSELFISEQVNYIVLNCPSCGVPLLFQGDHWIAVSKQIARQISSSPKESTVKDTINRIMHTTADTAKPFKFPDFVPENHIQAQSTDLERNYISADDILNLKIDLERAEDSLDFLARL